MKPPEIEGLIRRLRQIRFELEFIVTGDDKKFVYWIDRRSRGIFLRASPIDVAGLLQDKLFEEVSTCRFDLGDAFEWRQLLRLFAIGSVWTQQTI